MHSSQDTLDTLHYKIVQSQRTDVALVGSDEEDESQPDKLSAWHWYWKSTRMWSNRAASLAAGSDNDERVVPNLKS